ncbi:hypothetical protein GDO86_004139 [Hymenochirus boettgeri]|uniref:RING-type domain-containing protein n=1 Tax=Hymenochirus boettgeri TaxID=247094 RepID=A0A8T2K405_9PIPI|nr:hypothetical protein GDO86_004139 [Hymenochirus boettgeri]
MAVAQSVQNVTLSLTLPISCHICLGKVRQPVVCVNYHVFCSVCIDLWLKNNNQCPVCRVPVTPENPCKDLIGGTGENECVPSPTVRKHLRKTRLELLHKEYEEEIESLLKEQEELKTKYEKLEEQLSKTTHPAPVSLNTECKCEAKQWNKKDQNMLEEWRKKLEEAFFANRKLAGEMEKIKEEDRKLRIENTDYIRENLRLKAEVDNRSPQKFGRFTVAALQAKVSQYEREMSRLKKALERSDQYIEELESQVEKQKKPADQKQKEISHCEKSVFNKESVNLEDSLTVLKCQEEKLDKTSHKCETFEEICEKNPEDSKSECPDLSSQTHTGCWAKLQKGAKLFEENNCSARKDQFNQENGHTPHKMKAINESSSPSTSLSFSSLQLNSPDTKLTHMSNQIGMKKPLTYLRKLVFDEFPKREKLNSFETVNNEKTNCNSPNLSTYYGSGNKIHGHKKINLQSKDQVKNQIFRILPSNSSDQINSITTFSKDYTDAPLLDNFAKADNEYYRSPHCHNVEYGASMQSNVLSESGTQALPLSPYNTGFMGSSLDGSRSPEPQNLEFQKTISSSMSFNALQSYDQALLMPPSFENQEKEVNTELSWTSSCTDNSNKNGPASKRKLLNPVCESPPKSLKM